MFKVFKELLNLARQLTSRLVESEQIVDRIGQKVVKLMADVKSFDDLFNTIGAEIDGIVSKLQAGGLTAAEEDAELAKLQVVADRLKAADTPPPPINTARP